MPSYLPRIDIPPGAQPPVNVSPASRVPYQFENHDPNASNGNSHYYAGYGGYEQPQSSYLRSDSFSPRPIGRTISAYEPDMAQFAFPEPELNRSFSSHSSLRPGHRSSKSDVSLDRSDSISLSPSIADFSPQSEPSVLSEEFSHLTLDCDEGLRLFQDNKLPEAEQAWHLLVPPEAQEVLDKKEVQRQSTLFEVFKSEKDYVYDLELIQEVFVTPLLVADPPVMASDRVRGFISEVFWNLESISGHHHRMLAALFARQREQHPLVQSVADIVLDTSLLFRNDYESYIKHYPLAEARHRSELRKNQKYQAFIQKCSLDPRIRKRDLNTFLSRPVTRIPRLCLVLEHVLKLTQEEHPDLENLPLILSILNEFVKSTQPGIAAAESKVKFWNLCESLVYMKGEIIEMDLYDDSRTIVYSGSLARRSRSEVGHSWFDLNVALLDNYLLLTREEKRSNGVTKFHLTSRPIPLEYLRLGAFNEPSDTRRTKPEDAGILVRSQYLPVYPFTVYHASAKSSRRYTLFANTEASRNKWHAALSDALTVRRVRQEGNMWVAPQIMHDGFFRSATTKVSSEGSSRLTGKISSVAQTINGGKRFLIVGCLTGIYAGIPGESSFKKVLAIPSPTSIHVLQDYNKVVIHHGAELTAYSSEVLARYALGKSSKTSLDATYEKIAGSEGSVLFCRPGQIGKRTMLIFGSRSFLQVTVYSLEVVNPADTHLTVNKRSPGPGSASFRSFGDPFQVPKDAFDVTTLTKTIGICTDKGIVITDPTNFTNGAFNLVPDFTGASDNLAMYHLKTRCDSAKPLGVVRCDPTNSELLVVYDELGCFITKHGLPTRSCGYIRWESKATSFAAVGTHILLFSPEFIEIRHVATGKLVQVIEGEDIRLLYTGFKTGDRTVLVGMKGDKDDRDGQSYKLVDLVETQEIQTPTTSVHSESLWDMWDM